VSFRKNAVGICLCMIVMVASLCNAVYCVSVGNL